MTRKILCFIGFHRWLPTGKAGTCRVMSRNIFWDSAPKMVEARAKFEACTHCKEERAVITSNTPFGKVSQVFPASVFEK